MIGPVRYPDISTVSHIFLNFKGRDSMHNGLHTNLPLIKKVIS